MFTVDVKQQQHNNNNLHNAWKSRNYGRISRNQWERVEVWRHSNVFSGYIVTRLSSVRDTFLPSPLLLCEIFLRKPVNISVHVLAAGCQLYCRKFYIFTVPIQPYLECKHNCIPILAQQIKLQIQPSLTPTYFIKVGQWAAPFIARLAPVGILSSNSRTINIPWRQAEVVSHHCRTAHALTMLSELLPDVTSVIASDIMRPVRNLQSTIIHSPTSSFFFNFTLFYNVKFWISSSIGLAER